jgi:hypothetical protein
MSTKIIGNQIDAATRAIVTALSVTEQLNLPELNQTAVNGLGTPAFGTLIFNSTEDEAQIWRQDVSGAPGWASVGGGGPSIGENSIVRTNGTTISENLTIGPVANGGPEFTNGFSAAPITIANGYTVTIESGSSWTLIGPDEDLSSTRYFNKVGINDQLRLVPGAHLEFGQTKERLIAFSKSGTVNLDHSQANVFVTQNPTGYNGNFTINFQNVPTSGGFVYAATVLVRQVNGTGYAANIQVNGSSPQFSYWNNSSREVGTNWDVYQLQFFLDGGWIVFGMETKYE